MNTIPALLRRLGSQRLQVPSAILIALLQRSPVSRILQAAEQLMSEPPSAVFLKAAVASAASLGAVHTLAGATTYALVSTQQSPLAVTVHVPITAVGFTVTNTMSIGTWDIEGQIPPGLQFTAVEGGNTLTGPGILDATTPGADDGYGGMTGGNTQTTPVISGTPTQTGTYNLSLTAYEYAGQGNLSSPTYNFTITVAAAGTAPSFTTQPQSQIVSTGATVAFTVAVSDPSASIKWQKNGTTIPGATSATLTLANVLSGDAASYSAIATNATGSTNSSTVKLTVNTTAAPSFTTQPVSQTVPSGSTVVFNSAATGSPAPTYQWQLNGQNISGATSSRFVTVAASAGTYKCVATNSTGPATSNSATLAISASADFGRLVNLSVNSAIGNTQILTLGFVTGGNGTSGSQALLMRSAGPSLTGFGVANALPDPKLAVISAGGGMVASNDNWGAPALNQSQVAAAISATFAFPFSSVASLDAALVNQAPSGAYTVQVSGNGAAGGTVVSEIYDDTPANTFTAATPRLVNLSCNTQLSGSSTLTLGFVIGGSTSRTVLVRAIGPALAAVGIANPTPDPQIRLFDSAGNVLFSNAGWGGDPQISAAANSVFAYPLSDPNSKDSVVFITLSPGAYTAQAHSVSGTTGTVVVEVYEIP